MTVSPLRQLRPELLHSVVEELGRLLCEPFLIYRVGVPGVHVLHDVSDLPLVVRTLLEPPSRCCDADPLQFFQPPAELLPHAGTASRSRATSSKVRPSTSRTACFPVYCCQRRIMQSTYLGSISISRALRPRRSQPISVLPDPPNKSATISPALLLLTSARSISSTGLAVGWIRLPAGFFSSHRE